MKKSNNEPSEQHRGATMLGVIVVAVMLCVSNSCDSKPVDPGPPIHLPTVEEVGEAAGRNTTRFGRGFYKGVRDSLHGKEKESKSGGGH